MHRRGLAAAILLTLATMGYLRAQTSAPGKDVAPSEQAPVAGWLQWRGPQQAGISTETKLPDTWQPGGDNHLWQIDLPGRGTPVIAGNRVYAWGYRGEGSDLREVLVCASAESGKIIWERRFSDFISDIIYNRYSIGAPSIDARTGNVYLMTTPGLLLCLSPEGKVLWQHSMMEEFGRLTFPNGRTGSPAIDGDLVIVNAITTNWGREGPARNRFYAFDKMTGDLVWSSTPGVGPPYLKDSSFSTPVFEWRNGKRVFYVGTGCGNIVCVNARTGEPIWRYQFALGGVNSSVVLHGDTLIAIHGKENTDDTRRGRMVAIKLGAEPANGKRGPLVLDKSYEVWRNDELSMFTSSPVLVGSRVYQCTATGDLVCVDANTGQVLWKKKLATDQLHASPLYADGKIYLPFWNGTFYILEPSDEGCKVLSEAKLAGAALSSPSVWAGRVYVHTTEKLYCFGGKQARQNLAPWPQVAGPRHGHGRDRLQIVPAEVLLRPGQGATFSLRMLDARGLPTHVDLGNGGSAPLILAGNQVKWSKYIRPTAKGGATLDADFNEEGILVVRPDANLSAGAFQATAPYEQFPAGTFRGRILPSPPYEEDFESFELKHTHKTDGVKFAYPPLPWIGARLKWEVREVDGSKMLAKTLDRVLFQRTMTFIGHADEKNYTIEADVMSDGNRRTMGVVGLINQRYLITLVGNAQILEVVSNHERVKVGVPFRWKPRAWYRLKTRVDISADGSGVVRAKAWPRGDTEPQSWTIEAPVNHVHTQGAPGLFGFGPQSMVRVYIDNVKVTPNQ